MTETQAPYLTDDTAVTCPKCGQLVGWYKKVGSQVWLDVGPITCRVIRATCNNCGAEFDFDASGKRLEDLIKRAKINRE